MLGGAMAPLAPPWLRLWFFEEDFHLQYRVFAYSLIKM